MTDNPTNLLGNLLNFPTAGSQHDDTFDLMRVRFTQQRADARLDTYCETEDYYVSNAKDSAREAVAEMVEKGSVLMALTSRSALLIYHPSDLVLPLLAATIQAHGAHLLSLKLWGSQEQVALWKKRYEAKFRRKGATITTLVTVTKNEVFQTRTSFVSKDHARLARDCFYPFMTTSLQTYMKAYMESDASVLMLYGPPGTGKSTFLRTLMATHSEQAMLAFSKEVLESPLLMDHFQENDGEILGLEDSDLFIESRDRGNMLISSFLNESEGVVSSGKRKIVFSTNLPSVDRIDPALLRRGRCFDVIEFRFLTRDEARCVEKEMSLAAQSLDAKESWSLAEILNPPQDILQMSNRDRKKMGF